MIYRDQRYFHIYLKISSTKLMDRVVTQSRLLSLKYGKADSALKKYLTPSKLNITKCT